jgi:hypothetical protein|tara:strand:+ start:185 stop:457 length:273 start_codon:yes stop_codon:yes gene_type:complete
MNTDNIIPVEYINEAKVTKIVTRNRIKLLKESKLPVAKISKLIPVIPEKEYTHRRIRIRFFRDEIQKKDYYLLGWLTIIYFYVIYYLYTR